MLKIVQRSRDSQLDLTGGSRLASRQKVAHVPSMLEVEESCALPVALQDKSPKLAKPLARDSTQSRSQVTRTPCLGKTDFSYSFSPYYIYTLIPKILREKPQRKTRLIHLQSSHRDYSNSSTLFLSIVKSLRSTLPKPFLTIPISVRRSFGVWEAVKNGPISY